MKNKRRTPELARLYRLRDVVVPKIVRKDFTMAHWCQPVYDLKPGHKQPHKCGTTRCIAGWAATDASFKRQGLHMAKSKYGDGWYPLYGKMKGVMESLEAFFGITDQEAYDLFVGEAFDNGFNNKPSKKAIRAEITKIIRRQEEALAPTV